VILDSNYDKVVLILEIVVNYLYLCLSGRRNWNNITTL